MHLSRIMAAVLTLVVLLATIGGVALPGAIHAATAGPGGESGAGILAFSPGDDRGIVQAAPTAQAEDDDDDSGAGVVVGSLVGLIFGVVVIVAMWKMFTKAGKAGWLSLIPIVNAVVLLQIVGRPLWWIILFFIPLVNVIIWIIVSIDTAKSFGRSPAFGVVLIALLGGIGYLILGFGQDKYLGPVAATA